MLSYKTHINTKQKIQAITPIRPIFVICILNKLYKQ